MREEYSEKYRRNYKAYTRQHGRNLSGTNHQYLTSYDSVFHRCTRCLPQQLIVEYYLHWITTFDISFPDSQEANEGSLLCNTTAIHWTFSSIRHRRGKKCTEVLSFPKLTPGNPLR